MSHTPENPKELTKIGQLRNARKMTQSDLAKSVGVTEATIKNWEKKQPAWLEHTITLADELDCTLADLMEDGAVTQLRSQAELTRRELADRVGVKENTIAKWETEGVSNLEKLLRLCVALQCASRPQILVDFFNHRQKEPVLLTGPKLVKKYLDTLNWELSQERASSQHPNTTESG